MSDTHISRGFTGRRRETGDPTRIPPGQYLTRDFPVRRRVPKCERPFRLGRGLGVPARLWGAPGGAAAPALALALIALHAIGDFCTENAARDLSRPWFATEALALATYAVWLVCAQRRLDTVIASGEAVRPT